MNVFEKAGIDPEFYARREIREGEVLPWDHLDVGRTKDYLWKDYQAALQAAADREAAHA